MPFQNPTNLTLIDSNSLGITLSDDSGYAGASVALGDVNGDGKADMLIGAWKNNQAYLVFGSATPTAMDLGNMTVSTGVLLSGGSGGAGQSVALGDVNGDGKADMLIGAPYDNKANGAIYLVFGSSSPASVDLENMTTSTGVLLSGGSGYAGFSVALGDVNGDGKTDMLIGAPHSNQAYLVFGNATPTAVDLGNMTAGIGVLLSGGSGDAGFSVALGDVNGDGKADMLIGAPHSNQAYLVFGSATPTAVDLGNMTASTGVLLSSGSNYAGFSVALGDVNGDGKADMLIGAPFNNQAYLVFGSEMPAAVDLGNMATSTGVLLSGGSGTAGFSAALGDVNGDGKADMLIGASGSNQAYLVFGSATPTAADLGNMTTSTGVLLSGGSNGAGWSVALGDVNGDGKADMFIGAPGSNQTYLVYGGPPPEPITTCSALTNLNGLGRGNLALTGVQLTRGDDFTGVSVALGDVNGDGKADMLIGAPNGNQAYLVFGSATPTAVDLGNMTTSTGVLLSGGIGSAGASVALGDVNGDGKADMLIGAPDSSQAYLVFGSAIPTAVDLGAMEADTGVLLSGGNGEAGASVALGDVNGDGKADMLVGAPGNNQAYLVFGSAIPTAVDLGNMTASAVVLLSGGRVDAGSSVALGDVNGDGKADMLIGAPDSNQAYLVFGSATPTAVDLENMTASTGVSLSGGRGKTGWSVALGDVNGDGKADMLIGTFNGNQAYLVFGSATPTTVDLGNMTTSTGILLSNGTGLAGYSVALGDVNGDGKADMLIGSSQNSRTYLVFGSATPTAVDLGTMEESTGVLLSGGNGDAGTSVALGDVNGDGKADMLIGSPGGATHLVFGSQTPWFSSYQNNSTYLQGNPPLIINPVLALDENNPIISATVQISENYVQGDVLELSSALPTNITAEPFDTFSGTLTFNGTAPAYVYQQVLNSITYFNNASTFSPVPRTITFQANDGMVCGVSNQFNHTIYINATATSKPTPTLTPHFDSSQLAMLTALPIGGFFLLALVLGLFVYRRYQEHHEFDDDNFDDIEAQPLLLLHDYSEHELQDNLAQEEVASVSAGERLYQQALLSPNAEEKKLCLEQAKAQGHIASTFELAQLYEQGMLGQEKLESLYTAIEYYLEAESQGYTKAPYQLPRVYHKLAMAYQAVDSSQALTFYQKAIAAGYFEAQESLAKWVAEGFKLENFASSSQALQTQLKNHAYGVQAKQADDNKQKQAAMELLEKAQRTDAYNRSLLHLAVLYDCNHCLKVLIKKDAPVNQKDASGKTPLDIAKQQSLYQIISLLEEERLFEESNAKNETRFQQLLTQLQSTMPEEEEEVENQEELLQAQAQALKHSLLEITELDQLIASKEDLRKEAQGLDDYREKEQKDTLIDLIKRLKTPTQMLAKHSQKKQTTKSAIKKTCKHLAFLCKYIEEAKGQFTTEDKRLILTLLDNIQAYYQETLLQIKAKPSLTEQLSLFNPKAIIHAAGEEFRYRYLKLDAQSKLIGQTGERDNQHGIHEVKEYNGVHYKLQPYAPGVEYMVNSLAEIVAGHGTSPTALINISYRDNYIYQASKTVIGVNLEHIVLCHPELINKIDARNFSEMCILGILTDPQDGKADNYMARVYLNHLGDVESLRIVGIDNDIAFADPVVKQHRGEHEGKHYINVKNILYFFPQMDNPIHPEFRQYFLSHSPEVIIIQWLEALATKNEEYEALQEQGVLTEEQLTELQLPIKLVPGLALKLRDKIQNMQDIMRQQPGFTHRQLLGEIEPILQRYYEIIQAKETHPWRATLKLYKVAASSVEESLRLETKINSRHRLLTELAYHQSDIDAFQDNRTQTLQEAMEELITAINLPAVDNPAQKSVIAYINKLYLIEKLTLTNDCLLIRVSLPELVQRYQNIKVLTLFNCHQVTTNDILLTLMKHTQLILRLGDCSKISTPKDWMRISQDCKRFILLVGNLELNISEEEPEAMLKRCEEAGVATDAIRQFMRMLSKQEKRETASSSTVGHYRSPQTPKTLFFPTAKRTKTTASSSSSPAANDGNNPGSGIKEIGKK